MSYCLTLVRTSGILDSGHLDQAREFAKDFNSGGIPQENQLEQSRAVDFVIAQKPDKSQLNPFRAQMGKAHIDVFLTPEKGRQKKLLVVDMDGTVLDGESLDMLAEVSGCAKEIAEMTQQAMAGKMDFIEALTARVKMLENLGEDKIKQVLEKLVLHSGARKLVRSMQNKGAVCVLVTGGFAPFADWVNSRCGFDHVHCNHLEISGGFLTGQVRQPVVESATKRDLLIHYARLYQLDFTQVMAIGDGANDIPMLDQAGEGIGFQAKHIVRRSRVNNIIHADLSAALYIQGYKAHDIISD